MFDFKFAAEFRYFPVTVAVTHGLATGRSNKIATTLAIQDASQLRLNYGKELADVIVNICGNVIVGQVGGEIAKQISERLDLEPDRVALIGSAPS